MCQATTALSFSPPYTFLLGAAQLLEAFCMASSTEANLTESSQAGLSNALSHRLKNLDNIVEPTFNLA